jgi:hypothetical protein
MIIHKWISSDGSELVPTTDVKINPYPNPSFAVHFYPPFCCVPFASATMGMGLLKETHTVGLYRYFALLSLN